MFDKHFNKRNNIKIIVATQIVSLIPTSISQIDVWPPAYRIASNAEASYRYPSIGDLIESLDLP